MSASSSRIMIAPVDNSRPLSDRFIDRLLEWWDVGGGRSIRRALRAAVANGTAKIGTLLAPVLARPAVAKTFAISSAALATLRHRIGKAFSSDVPVAAARHTEVRAAGVSPASDMSSTPAHPAVATRTGTAEIRTPLRSATAEIRTPTGTGTTEMRRRLRSGTGEIRPRTATSITRSTLTPVSSAPAQTAAMTTNLRCWSCLQRNRVRTPRRGGCFLCTACNTTMLVIDPIVGLTCAVAEAENKGIRPDRQADETDPG